MLEFLNELDAQLFLILNSWHCNACDVLMWWASDKLIWLPFYLFLLFLLIRKYKWETIAILFAIAILIALSDQVSGLIKDSVMRLRPSHSPDLVALVRTLKGYVGGNYGFVSSHAANSFGMAYFVYSFLKKDFPNYSWLLFVWAFVVSHSRIYLGVHYPGDILGGALLGLVLASLVRVCYNWIIAKSCFAKQC
ncbi:MAG: phosphatase PAP2 family protein [Bacteroidales bacterium]|nr:phosphatase PAP2 family protein [Bacteroidales bacterium]